MLANLNRVNSNWMLAMVMSVSLKKKFLLRHDFSSEQQSYRQCENVMSNLLLFFVGEQNFQKKKLSLILNIN